MLMNKWWADGDLLQIVGLRLHINETLEVLQIKKKKRFYHIKKSSFGHITPKSIFSHCSQCFHSHQIPTFPSLMHNVSLC